MSPLITNEIISFVYLIGAAQGVLFAIALLTRKVNLIPNKILAVWLLCASVNLTVLFLVERDVHHTYPHLVGVTRAFPFLYGPFFYLYTRLLIKKAQRIDAVLYLHFLPFVLYLTFLAIFLYPQSGAYKLAYYEKTGAEELLYISSIVDWLFVIHGFTYIYLTLRLLKRHAIAIRRVLSNIEHIRLNWLRVLAGLQICTWLIVFGVIYLAVGKGVTFPFTTDAPIYMSVVIQLCLIGYFGQRQPELFAEITQVSAEVVVEPKKPPANSGDKYGRSGLKSEQAEQISKDLSQIMEVDKPYLDSELTLPQLAERLGISTHNLSEVINSRLEQSFYDFINRYRVEEVKRLLADKNYQHFTLLAIAQEAGFKTKSTFNAMFKKHAYMTPTQFKKSLVQRKAA